MTVQKQKQLPFKAGDVVVWCTCGAPYLRDSWFSDLRGSGHQEKNHIFDMSGQVCVILECLWSSSDRRRRQDAEHVDVCFLFSGTGKKLWFQCHVNFITDTDRVKRVSVWGGLPYPVRVEL